LAACRWWSKQWTPLIVDAVQQDGQEQAVVYVADVEQRGPGGQSQLHGGMESLAPRPRINVTIRLAAMDRREPMWCGGKNVTDVVVAQRDGRNRGELRRAAMVKRIGVD